jgi:hypothetical protein
MKDKMITLQHSLYDQGLTKGTESFSDGQKLLYNYFDMLYYVEIGGFTGFLYNNIDKDDRMPAFVHCLFYFGFLELSQQLDNIYRQAKGQQWQEAEGWDDYLTRLHLIDKVDALETHFYKELAGYPIDNWIEQHYEDLSGGIDMQKQ